MRIGVDLGGTKIEGVALDDAGREVCRLRRATPKRDYPGTIQALAELVAQIEMAVGERGTVGVGTPGSISRMTGRMKNCNTTWMNGQPMKADIEAALGREIRLTNDADCFALSEATDGAGAGFATVFGVIIGTGVGGGLVAHGRLIEGPNGIAGEWGHNQLPYVGHREPGGHPCYCGRADCIETYLAGPAFKAMFAQADGREMQPAEIAAAAAAGDSSAYEALDRYCDRLARALAVVINIFDPHAIVLGGGMSNIDALYARVPLFWGRYIFSDDVATKLVRNHHGDSSGVRGAAWLWPASNGQ